MAVEDKYVNTKVAAGQTGSGGLNQGARSYKLLFQFSVAAGDDNLSVYRIARALPASAVLTKVEIFNEEITGGTDYDLGLYEPLDDAGSSGSGPEIDKDVFLDGVSMASARTRATGPLDGLTQIAAVSNNLKALWEHAGHTLATRTWYDLAFTANVAGTATGVISGYVEYIIP